MNSGSRIAAADALYLNRLRGMSISRVVLGHLGLFWLFPPYTQFLHALLPLLFFVSGAVSFFSFRRADTAGTFLVRRMARLLIPYYLLVGFTFVFLWAGAGKLPRLQVENLFCWLTLTPPAETMPFPLDQVWFLHALAVITLFAPIVFRAMEDNLRVPLMLIGFSLTLSLCRLFGPIHRNLELLSHNIYDPIVNAGFFFFGAMVYARREFFCRAILQLIGAAGAAVAGVLVLLFDVSVNLADHSYKPDLYYVVLGYVAIALMLLTQDFWTCVLHRLRRVDAVLLFVSQHAYSLFLLHTFFIVAAEHLFGLVSVASDPLRAAAKIAIVCTASAVCAVPFSRASRFCIRQIDAALASRQKAHDALSQEA